MEWEQMSLTNGGLSKPPYKVLSMQEIAELPWNGYNVVSTFSGCGGSCLGYRMAGYKVRWANEFIPEAQKTYKANHADSILDTRDIRQVSAQDILDATGLGTGDIDIMDGSPPCAAFSTSGKREKGWGTVKKYSDSSQRVDDLFFEYTRILKQLQPKTFVAENVSGLVKGSAKGYFLLILQALKDCGYEVKCKLLDAQWLGVPQSRQRTIFVGVRKDLQLTPVHPIPFPYRYTVRDAISSVPHSNSLFYKLPQGKMMQLYEAAKDYRTGAFSDAHIQLFGKDSFFNHRRLPWDQPSCTIVQGSQSAYHPDESRTLSLLELRRICGFPDDFVLTGSFAQQWERLGRAVPPVMMSHIAKTIQTEILDKL